MTTGMFPPISNRYDLVCNDSVGDDAPVSTQESTIVMSKYTGKNKTVRKKRVSKEEQHKKQHKIIVVGDSHVRKCATEVSQLLNKDFEVLGFVNPGPGMKYVGTSKSFCTFLSVRY
jgi:hypothetical protein